jgi:hypothetical protein
MMEKADHQEGIVMRYLVICTLIALICIPCSSSFTVGAENACKKVEEYLAKVRGVFTAYSTDIERQRQIGKLREQYSASIRALPPKLATKVWYYPMAWEGCVTGEKFDCTECRKTSLAVVKACK